MQARKEGRMSWRFWRSDVNSQFFIKISINNFNANNKNEVSKIIQYLNLVNSIFVNLYKLGVPPN